MNPNELRRSQQVADVVESEFFSGLQKCAREIRNKDQDADGRENKPSE